MIYMITHRLHIYVNAFEDHIAYNNEESVDIVNVDNDKETNKIKEAEKDEGGCVGSASAEKNETHDNGSLLNSDVQVFDNSNKGVKATVESGNNLNGKYNNGPKTGHSYANAVSQSLFDKKIISIPTEIDESGNEFVMFNEDLIAEGSKKWEMTVCGYFVGCNMAMNELRFNLRKMWNRHGFKDIIDQNKGIFFMKFHNSNGMEYVLNNGPWMVNNKPFVVQKWDINMNLDKTEPATLPVWIKLGNLPLEAWTTTGISALASRVGTPMIMDTVTASMCKMGVGRIGYARVLVEVSAEKDLPNMIECGKKEDVEEVVKQNVSQGVNEEPVQTEVPKADEGFKEVKYKKNKATGARNNNGLSGKPPNRPQARYEFQPKAKVTTEGKNEGQQKGNTTPE
ncbi:hypothetical protein CTI12_AA260310 [Artemisia annua]|uniref:DUF4283 domain-containing protein n=1 Tax=Artemisia annua TaxID=35608 RepID=A0A2U1NBT4_ARTAN|nr:hypothetical protein CTI12_AA260310 [Artemisia annua]